MASKKIKGIIVEIGGDTSPLVKALEQVDKKAASLQSELREVNKALKLDPGNTELLAQKQTILAQQLDLSKERADILRQSMSELEKEGAKPIGEEQQRALQREYITTAKKAEALEEQIKETNQAASKISDAGDAISGVGNKISGVGQKIMPLSKGVAALGTAAFATVPATEELRTDLSKLDNNATEAGISIDKVRDAFQKFNVVSDETDSSVEATSNLLQAGFTESNLQKAVEGLAGAYLRFPDTLKIESLADSLQETIATGEATGQFGELLDRLGIGAESFSEKLSECTTETEKQQLALQTLADAGLNDTYSAWVKNNEALVKNKTANAELQEQMASLAETLQPLLTAVTELTTKMLSWFNGLSDSGQKVVLVIGAILAAVGPVVTIIGNIVSAVGTVIKVFGALKTAMAAGGALAPVLGGIKAALAALSGPVGWIIAGISALVAGFVLLWKNCEGFREFWINLWENIKEITANVVDALVVFFTETIPNAWQAVVDWFAGIPEWWNNLWQGIADGAKNIWDGMISGIQNAWSGITEFFSGLWQGITSGASSIWQGIVSGLQPFIDIFLNIWNGAKDGLSQVFEGIKLVFSGAWEAIKNIVLAPVLFICDLITGDFDQLKSDMANIWENIKSGISTVWEGIKTYFSGWFSAITGAFSAGWEGVKSIFSMAQDAIKQGITAVWEAIKTFFSNTWTAIGEGISSAWNGFLETITSLCTSIKEFIINLWNSIITWFQELPGKLLKIGSDMFTYMKNGISSTIHGVVDTVKSGVGAAIDWLKSLPSQAMTWGKDMIQGFINGIKSMIGAITSAVSGIAERIREFLHFSVPDKGPLTDYESWMPDFMKGLAEGIEQSKHYVTDALQGLTYDMQLNPQLAVAGNGPTGQISQQSDNSINFHIENFYETTGKGTKGLVRESMEAQEAYRKQRERGRPKR
ncbi:MAG: hypothetical protein ACOX60_06355 [Massiliimalia sp.]|jgi:phage-related minor tail protein